MKKEITRFFTCSLTLFVMVAVNTIVYAYPGGSPAGYTGSPGDSHHCVSCHGGSAVNVNGWITSNIPSGGYTAGTPYTITITVTGTGKKGFELSPQDASGLQLGVLSAGTGSHLVGGTKYVTQSSAGSTSGTSAWSFGWTAPATGTGTVTFYAACTVGKANTKLTTMVVGENPALPLSAQASATPSPICLGESSQLDVAASGGSGAYTYLWSSVPAGFSSTLRNPVATPAVSTQYSVHVSDGTGAVDAATQVTVNQPATAIAGNDTTFPFVTTQVPLNGTAANYSAVLWTTSGTGTFSAATSLSGVYYPGAADKTTGNVTLALTASAQSPCSIPAVSLRHIHFDGPAGIADTGAGYTDLVISPNPSTGFFTLRFSSADLSEAIVTITDLRGKTVLQQPLAATSAQAEKVDMSGYPKGIYLVKIRTATKSLVRKLIIE
jgi:hypothetical protein